MTHSNNNDSHEDVSPRAVIEECLGELKQLAKKKAQPNRFHARALLMALGSLLLKEGDEVPESAQVLEAVKPFDGWEKAVAEEMSLACTEHVQGVDPRFLSLPNFDFDYLVVARQRLEERFTALDALGLNPPEQLLDRVAEADRAVEPYLREHRGEPGAN